MLSGCFVRLAGFPQQTDELPQPGPRHVAQLPGMATTDGFVERLQEFDSRLGDPHLDHAAVFGQPLAANQVSFFELVQQPGDIGRAGNEPLGRAKVGRLGMSRPQ